MHEMCFRFILYCRHYEQGLNTTLGILVHSNFVEFPVSFWKKGLVRGPNLFFKYFYFIFGPGLFYPLRVIATVQIFFGTLVGPLTGPTKLPKKI